MYIWGTLAPSTSSMVVLGNMPSNVMSPPHEPTLSGLHQATPVKVTPEKFNPSAFMLDDDACDSAQC